jgi:uncharacterized membrane protein YccF (DUF307 family)
MALGRIAWFLLIGWWLGLLWFGLSLAVMLTIVLLPVGAYMMAKTWKVMTLQRKPTKVIVEARNQR